MRGGMPLQLTKRRPMRNKREEGGVTPVGEHPSALMEPQASAMAKAAAEEKLSPLRT
jgi:hypothetical protein